MINHAVDILYKDYDPFIAARPIWIKNKSQEKNITIGLYAHINSATKPVLRITASNIYRVFINGSFFSYGPSRCADDYFRVDELPLPENQEIHISIEAVNNYINTYDSLCQSGFVTAEIADGGKVLAATGDDSFLYFEIFNRVGAVQRYSCQRTFVESYKFKSNYGDWYIGKECQNTKIAEIETLRDKNYLPRIIPQNTFFFTGFEMIEATGRFKIGCIPDNYYKDRSLLLANRPDKGFIGGFSENELECCLSNEVQELKQNHISVCRKNLEGGLSVGGGEFVIVSLKCEKTGFLSVDIFCKTEGTVYFLFDEILDKNGNINPFRLECTNIIKFDVEKGYYRFLSLNPYGLKYLKIMVKSGDFSFNELGVIEYICPEKITSTYVPSDKELSLIFDAAKETFLQNSADILMDCPTRERAGWLCDSFFTAKAEKFFTGNNLIERNFLENYLLPEKFANMPDGMLPMCYPADHPSGRFIPNWAMWLVIELYDYMFNRGGKAEFVMLFNNRIYSLLEWLKKYEKNGLLTDLPGWVFVEWSKANDFTSGVNFPTNMLYYAVLKSVSEMFRDEDLLKKSMLIKEMIKTRSFDGEFFVDNEILNDSGEFVSSGNITETCQYYAFFFGIADPDEYPKLWKHLVNDFGPQRDTEKTFPDIYKSNAFIGNYLRLFILKKYGFHSKVLKEIRNYFYYMAEKTGTLWEHTNDYASCNHGFASSIAQLIYECDTADLNLEERNK